MFVLQLVLAIAHDATCTVRSARCACVPGWQHKKSIPGFRQTQLDEWVQE